MKHLQCKKSRGIAWSSAQCTKDLKSRWGSCRWKLRSGACLLRDSQPTPKKVFFKHGRHKKSMAKPCNWIAGPSYMETPAKGQGQEPKLPKISRTPSEVRYWKWKCSNVRFTCRVIIWAEIIQGSHTVYRNCPIRPLWKESQVNHSCRILLQIQSFPTFLWR